MMYKSLFCWISQWISSALHIKVFHICVCAVQLLDPIELQRNTLPQIVSKVSWIFANDYKFLCTYPRQPFRTLPSSAQAPASSPSWAEIALFSQPVRRRPSSLHPKKYILTNLHHIGSRNFVCKPSLSQVEEIWIKNFYFNPIWLWGGGSNCTQIGLNHSYTT